MNVKKALYVGFVLPGPVMYRRLRDAGYPVPIAASEALAHWIAARVGLLVLSVGYVLSSVTEDSQE